MNVGEAYERGRLMLKSCGIESPALDTMLILQKAAGLTRTELATKSGLILSEAEISSFEIMIAERAAHKPVQYILKTCEFMSLDFCVDESVLIPRPDTEILTEAVIAYTREQPGSIRVLEIGTGSGCIAVSLAKYAENAEVIAADISLPALEIACLNARMHGLGDRVKFIQSDVYSGIPARYKGTFDIIMSNPPYIESHEIPLLPSSVKDYEPKGALDGGTDGLDFYREIIMQAREYLKPEQGRLFMEIGSRQGEAVVHILGSCGFSPGILKDLSGLDRVAVGLI